MNKDDPLPGWLYTRDITAKLIFYLKTETSFMRKSEWKEHKLHTKHSSGHCQQ
jgi:hypothetical protein